jgi:hypothetical protein
MVVIVVIVLSCPNGGILFPPIGYHLWSNHMPKKRTPPMGLGQKNNGTEQRPLHHGSGD